MPFKPVNTFPGALLFCFGLALLARDRLCCVDDAQRLETEEDWVQCELSSAERSAELVPGHISWLLRWLSSVLLLRLKTTPYQSSLNLPRLLPAWLQLVILCWGVMVPVLMLVRLPLPFHQMLQGFPGRLQETNTEPDFLATTMVAKSQNWFIQ